MGFLEHVRSNPESVRTQYALGIAGLVTGIIGIIWVTTIPAKFSKTAQNLESETALFHTLGDAVGDIENQVANVIESSSERLAEVDTANLDSLHKDDFAPILPSEDVSVTHIVSDVVTSTPLSVYATTSDIHVYTTPQPKVILIGTTTKNISE